MLEIRNVTKSYDEKAVLSSVCFTLLDGESLLLAGETGGGKTTLARIICGSQCPDSGEVLLDGKRLLGTYRKRSPEELADIQYIFQDPYSAVELTNTLRQTLGETERVMKRHGRGCIPMEEALFQTAPELLGDMDKKMEQFSGGQLQRLSILRSMMLHPRLLVADEPVSMLDVSVRAEVMDLLEDLKARYHMSMVFISHDIATTRVIADKVAVMYLGHIVEIGETDEVIQSPRHPYTKALISNCGTLDTEGFHPIQISGEPPVPIGQAPGCGFAPRCWLTCPRCTEKDPVYTEVSPGHLVACACLDQMK